MLIFQPLPNSLFELAGLGFGRIIEDDGTVHVIEHLADATQAFTEISRKNYDTDAINVLRDSVESVNLAGNTSEIIQAITKVDLPEDFDAKRIEFESCTGCGIPFPHGYVTDRGSVVSSTLACLEDGLGFIWSGIRNDCCSTEQGVHLLQQMVATDMMQGRRQVQQRIEELPEDVLAQMSVQRVSVSSINMPGIGPSLVFEIGIDGPREKHEDSNTKGEPFH